MSQTYYKVVINHGNKLVSCCQNWKFPEPFRVTYEVGKWSKPKLNGSKLFVFKTFTAAKNFANMLSDRCVYECEVKGKPITIKIFPPVERMVAFWKDRLQKKQTRQYMYPYAKLPQKTLLVDEVKLIKRV